MIGHIEVVVIMVNIYHLCQVSFQFFFYFERGWWWWSAASAWVKDMLSDMEENSKRMIPILNFHQDVPRTLEGRLKNTIDGSSPGYIIPLYLHLHTLSPKTPRPPQTSIHQWGLLLSTWVFPHHLWTNLGTSPRPKTEVIRPASWRNWRVARCGRAWRVGRPWIKKRTFFLKRKAWRSHEDLQDLIIWWWFLEHFFFCIFGDLSIEMLSVDSAGNEGFSSEISQGRRHLKPFIALKRRDGLIAISLVSCLRMGALGIFCWDGKRSSYFINGSPS